MTASKWWDEAAGFFGDFYADGDRSEEGHVAAKKMSIDERTAREVDGVVRLLSLKPRQRVLDVPCGYGRHAIALASRGYGVVGVDLNERHLRMARSSAAADGVRIEFVKNDMLTLNVPQKFDACEQYHRMTNRIDGAWAIERNGKTAEKLYSVRVYEVEEFIAMCSEAGFKSCRAYGSWEGDAYESNSSEEIIFVAKVK